VSKIAHRKEAGYIRRCHHDEAFRLRRDMLFVDVSERPHGLRVALKGLAL
jgi:hypothetical protein